MLSWGCRPLAAHLPDSNFFIPHSLHTLDFCCSRVINYCILWAFRDAWKYSKWQLKSKMIKGHVDDFIKSIFPKMDALLFIWKLFKLHVPALPQPLLTPTPPLKSHLPNLCPQLPCASEFCGLQGTGERQPLTAPPAVCPPAGCCWGYLPCFPFAYRIHLVSPPREPLWMCICLMEEIFKLKF